MDSLPESFEQRLRILASYELVGFDLDGTLVTTKSGETFRKTENDWQWLPNRLALLHTLRNQHVRLGICTNQGGVAIGKLNERLLVEEFHTMQHEVFPGITPFFAASHFPIVYCTYLPPRGTQTFGIPNREEFRRKPLPGMLFELAVHHAVTITRHSMLFVGDRPEDKRAADLAGCDFMWSARCFGDPEAVFFQQMALWLGSPWGDKDTEIKRLTGSSES